MLSKASRVFNDILAFVVLIILLWGLPMLVIAMLMGVK